MVFQGVNTNIKVKNPLDIVENGDLVWKWVRDAKSMISIGEKRKRENEREIARGGRLLSKGKRKTWFRVRVSKLFIPSLFFLCKFGLSQFSLVWFIRLRDQTNFFVFKSLFFFFFSGLVFQNN